MAKKQQNPQKQKPQGQKPQGQKPQGQKPQKQKPQGQKPQGQKPQGQKPQKQKPQGQKPQGQVTLQSFRKRIENLIFPKGASRLQKFVAVIIVLGIIVGIIILVKVNTTKENLLLPPTSLNELTNIQSKSRNNFNIYNQEGDFVINSCEWNRQKFTGNYGTSVSEKAGKTGTNFTFSYPLGEENGAQIRNQQGQCLDTNPWRPGNDKNIISKSWWWNDKCYTNVNQDEILKSGQVGFKLNKRNQLEFTNGHCLDVSNPQKHSVCKEHKKDPKTFFQIVPSQNSKEYAKC